MLAPRTTCFLFLSLAMAVTPPAEAAPNASQLCESDKLVASSRFAQCRLKADATFAKNGNAGQRASTYERCAERLAVAYQRAEARYVGACATLGDESAAEQYLQECTDTTALATNGSGFPTCGNDVIDVAGEQCDGADLGGETCASIGFLDGALACSGGCSFDTSGCTTTFCGNGTVNAPEQCDGASLNGQTCEGLGFASGNLTCTDGCALDTSGCVPNPASTCGNGVKQGVEQCDGADLDGATCASLGYTLGGALSCTSGCGYDTLGCDSQASPATGQTTCWDSSGASIPCAGTGQDGDVQAGATLTYVDNLDGTITDVNTGLMWEKICDQDPPGATCPAEHDVDTTYTWENAFAVKIAALNAGAGFANHTDWRVPNLKELENIVNLQTFNPAISPAFNTGCVPPCSVLTCSCTFPSSFYWSSSSAAFNGFYAWNVGFNDGNVNFDGKTQPRFVRAVRGGM